MKHTAFAFGFASLVAASAAQPRQVSAGALGHDDVGRPARPVIQPVLAASAEIAMPVDDVHTWLVPAPAADPRALRRRERREHARRHDDAVRAGLATLLVRERHDDGTRTGLATLLAPAPGQANISLQRPLLGRDERPLAGNVMKHSKGKSAGPDWTDE